MVMAARPRTFDRSDVLEDALRVFWHQGYEATSVQDLVDATGLSRASLYNTFGSKHALYLDALQRYRAQRRAALLNTLALDTPVSDSSASDSCASGAVRALLERVADEAAACPNEGSCLLTHAATERAASDAEAADAVRSGFAELEDALARTLQHGQERGDIQTHARPQAQARFLVTTIQGMRVLAKTCPSRSALQDVVETALRAIVPPSAA